MDQRHQPITYRHVPLKGSKTIRETGKKIEKRFLVISSNSLLGSPGNYTVYREIKHCRKKNLAWKDHGYLIHATFPCSLDFFHAEIKRSIDHSASHKGRESSFRVRDWTTWNQKVHLSPFKLDFTSVLLTFCDCFSHNPEECSWFRFDRFLIGVPGCV